MDIPEYCNAGVWDCSGFDIQGEADKDSFSVEAFRSNHPEWATAEPRSKIIYPKSPHIDTHNLTNILADFSIKRNSENNHIKTLREAIQQYVFKLDSTRHLFCIHSRPYPEFYFERTILMVPNKLPSMRKTLYPQVIVITESAEKSNRVSAAFLKEREKLKVRRSDCGIRNMDKALLEENGNRNMDSIMIGSYDAIHEYIAEVIQNRQIQDLKSSLKFIVINSLEKLHILPNFGEVINSLAIHFNISWTRFIFMYNFVNATGSLLNTIRFCLKMNKERMFIEVDRPVVRDLFEIVDFHLISPAEGKATVIAGLESAKDGTEFSQEIFQKSKIYLPPQQQKMRKCMKLIQKIREARENRNNGSRQKRRERILVVASNHKVARFLMFSLHHMNLMRDENSRYTVNTILEYDSEEDVELRNFEFRHGKLDVLVIDWKSIQSVMRGTVDSIIMYDRPHPMYFQTIMETEMENLTSRNCVKLNLFILFDETEDLFLLPNYIRFAEKYNKAVPQWFHHLYEKFRSNHKELIQEDSTLVNTSQFDDTLQ